MTVSHLTASLNEVKNDTGRIAFCGPYVLAAITGYPISRMEDEIRTFREIPAHRKPIVKGTDNEEVAAALAHFGYRMNLRESYMHLERKERPSIWTWMQKPRSAWTHFILAVHKGREGRHLLRRPMAIRVRRPAQGCPDHGSVRGAEGSGSVVDDSPGGRVAVLIALSARPDAAAAGKPVMQGDVFHLIQLPTGFSFCGRETLHHHPRTNAVHEGRVRP